MTTMTKDELRCAAEDFASFLDDRSIGFVLYQKNQEHAHLDLTEVVDLIAAFVEERLPERTIRCALCHAMVSATGEGHSPICLANPKGKVTMGRLTEDDVLIED